MSPPPPAGLINNHLTQFRTPAAVSAQVSQQTDDGSKLELPTDDLSVRPSVQSRVPPSWK